jgi:hypothetical protein
LGTEEFIKYDTIQLTTLYESGRFTYRRGVIIGIEFEGDECVSVATTNSTFEEYSCGIVIIEGEFRKYRGNKRHYTITSMLPCRIVLVEKYIKNRWLVE